MRVKFRIGIVGVMCLIGGPIFANNLLRPDALSVGIVQYQKPSFQLEIEKYLTSKSALVFQTQASQINSKTTQEWILGGRRFSQANKVGPFYGAGFAQVSLSEGKSTQSYFVEFGGRLPFNNTYFLSVSTKLDYMELDKRRNVRASINARIGSIF